MVFWKETKRNKLAVCDRDLLVSSHHWSTHQAEVMEGAVP